MNSGYSQVNKKELTSSQWGELKRQYNRMSALREKLFSAKNEALALERKIDDIDYKMSDCLYRIRNFVFKNELTNKERLEEGE